MAVGTVLAMCLKITPTGTISLIVAIVIFFVVLALLVGAGIAALSISESGRKAAHDTALVGLACPTCDSSVRFDG